MSRPDTSLLFKFPQIDRREQDLAEAQKQALIAERGAQVQNQLAQAEERKRQADKLRQDNEEKRRTYNAQEGARAYIQDARARGLPTPSMDDLIGRFGNDAMPFLTAMTARDKEDLANQKERSDNYIKLHGAMIDALSLEPDESKHQEIERTVYQRAVQQGLITTNEANQYLQQPPDKLDQLEASRKAEQRKNDELKAASERNFKDAETLKNAAQTAQAQAETHRKELENARIEQDQPPVPTAPKTPVPGVDVPFSKDVEDQKTRIATAQAAARRAAQGSSNDDDIHEVANGIADGTLPPDTPLYRNGIPVQAELHRLGYNLAEGKQDYKAVQKHLATLNGAQQERLRQAAQFVDETIPQIETAYAEWKKQAGVSGFKIINKATLATMANMPGAAGSAATQLTALIGDFTSELGTVYKGGNSSTDESLQLAAKNLQGDWNEQTFKDAVARLKTSMKIRRNSYMTSQAVGVSADSPYLGKSAAVGGGGGTPAPAAPSGDAMIDVETGEKTGKIHASQWEAFKQKYPDAKKK